MRQFISLVENLNQPSFDGIVYHCSNVKFDHFRMDTNRGVYFANEADAEYGQYIYKCHVTLLNAYYADSLDNFEIDRNLLIAQGYDGRIVDYAEEAGYEMYDIIAFHDDQITILEVTQSDQANPV